MQQSIKDFADTLKGKILEQDLGIGAEPKQWTRIESVLQNVTRACCRIVSTRRMRPRYEIPVTVLGKQEAAIKRNHVLETHAVVESCSVGNLHKMSTITSSGKWLMV